jgi:large subunit ribosomal protein L18
MQKTTRARVRRHTSLRKRLTGSTERPRLAVFRSNRHIYAQIIDDVNGKTLVAASSLEDGVTKGAKNEVALQVGKLVGERAKQAGIATVVFDRGGFKYHGRVAQVATGARDAGLEF